LRVYTADISGQGSSKQSDRCQQSHTAADKQETLSTTFVIIKINNTGIKVGTGLFILLRNVYKSQGCFGFTVVRYVGAGQT
jgi:hypothetical protein